MREAHYEDLHIYVSRSMPEAFMVCVGEDRQSGRPSDKDTVRYMEASPCRRPYIVQLGSPRAGERTGEQPGERACGVADGRAGGRAGERANGRGARQSEPSHP